MKIFKSILVVLLLAIALPCSAETIVERGANYNKYQVNSDTYRLEIGGDNENALPFDGGSYQPWDLVFANGTSVGNWTWLGKGTQGYLVKPSTSTVRIYPVRGDQSKYIEIAPISAQPSLVNQISNKHLELYVDQANTRWSLHMTPQGFKPEILLKSGWSGTPEWQFRFELNGLTLSGTKIMDGDVAVLSHFSPFIIDANGTIFPVSESVSDGIATLTANMTGVVLPAVVDPTFGPTIDSADSYVTAAAPTTNYGSATAGSVNGQAAAINRGMYVFPTFGVIPNGSTINSATLTIWITLTDGLFVSQEARFHPITKTWIESQVTWNIYSTGNSWDTAGGDYDAGTADVHNLDASTGFVNFTTTNVVQYAVDNLTDVNFIHKFTSEAYPGLTRIVYRTKENPTYEPTLTVTYTAPSASGVTSTHLGYPQMVF